jgi:hypothetical protein
MYAQVNRFEALEARISEPVFCCQAHLLDPATNHLFLLGDVAKRCRIGIFIPRCQCNVGRHRGHGAMSHLHEGGAAILEVVWIHYKPRTSQVPLIAHSAFICPSGNRFVL